MTKAEQLARSVGMLVDHHLANSTQPVKKESDMRPVTVYEWFRPDDAKYNDPYQRREVGSGTFHQFGVDGEFSSDSGITYTTAIVEMPDGTVKNVPVDLIQFMDVDLLNPPTDRG